jgi:hypothetical protein
VKSCCLLLAGGERALPASPSVSFGYLLSYWSRYDLAIIASRE